MDNERVRETGSWRVEGYELGFAELVTLRQEIARETLAELTWDGEEGTERLELMVVVDNSVVEVHANGKFALSTWAWYITVYEELFNSWSERPW